MKQEKKTIAFYIEALLLTLFLLGCLTVLVQLFGAARTAGTQAKRKTEAVRIAQNVTALFEAGSDAFAAVPEQGKSGTVTLVYAADGTQTQDGCYTVTVTMQTAGTQAGQMVSATLEIVSAEAPQAVLCQLELKRYIPDKQ